MPLNRRQMLSGTALTGAAVLTASSGLLAPVAAAATVPSAGTRTQSVSPRGVNPLFPPLRSDPGDLLALPAGFSYEVVAVSGETDIHDGTGHVIGKTPERPDGTLVVAGRNGYRMIQNHEASNGSPQPVPQVDGTVYDPGILGGGCTVIEVTKSGRR